MGKICRLLLLTFCCFLLCFITASRSHAGPLKMTSSTQFLWGDDWVGDSSAILAQYLRFSYQPEKDPFTIAGYGRVWYDFGDTQLYESEEFLGRLYYLYFDYRFSSKASFRLGRQYVNFSSGSSLMDGLTFDIHEIGPFGITFSGGRDVKYSLDAEHSSSGNIFYGVDLRLETVKQLQLGISYTRRYDSDDLAREEVGANFRYIHKYFSPYAEARYDLFAEVIDEATAGIDFFPLANLMIKAEYYQSYPTFDATSIYSVFAVDRYSEYLVRVEYSLNAPLTLYASYAHQMYEDDDTTDNYLFGVRVYPIRNLTLNAAVNYRNGYGGNLWGFEITGDYLIDKKISLAGGVQYNSYRRPDFTSDDYEDANRFWIGAQWMISKNFTLAARIEDNINENFDHRPLGRVSLNWNL